MFNTARTSFRLIAISTALAVAVTTLNAPAARAELSFASQEKSGEIMCAVTGPLSEHLDSIKRHDDEVTKYYYTSDHLRQDFPDMLSDFSELEPFFFRMMHLNGGVPIPKAVFENDREKYVDIYGIEQYEQYLRFWEKYEPAVVAHYGFDPAKHDSVLSVLPLFFPGSYHIPQRISDEEAASRLQPDYTSLSSTYTQFIPDSVLNSFRRQWDTYYWRSIAAGKKPELTAGEFQDNGVKWPEKLKERYIEVKRQSQQEEDYAQARYVRWVLNALDRCDEALRKPAPQPTTSKAPTTSATKPSSPASTTATSDISSTTSSTSSSQKSNSSSATTSTRPSSSSASAAEPTKIPNPNKKPQSAVSSDSGSSFGVIGILALIAAIVAVALRYIPQNTGFGF